MAISDDIKAYLKGTFAGLGVNLNDKDLSLTIPEEKEHGDYSTNVALRFAKKLNANPLALAQSLARDVHIAGVAKAEAVKPGFLNFFVTEEELTDVIGQVIEKGSAFGNLAYGKGKRVDIEYVSANPTGYLHLGHARGAAIGDSLARIMKKAGFDVTREYYINDAGNQIDHMAESLIARYLQKLGDPTAKVPDDGYHGQDIIDIADELVKEVGDKYKADPQADLAFFKEYGTAHLMAKIKKDLKRFRVEFDVFTSEKAVRKSGRIEEALKILAPKTYRKDNALFLRTTDDGDDKDRVIIKSDGSYTYFLPDIAYHWDKFSRGFDLLIDVFGADHAGYVARLKSAVKSLGYDPERLQVTLVQIVRLFKGGVEYKMSKRSGNAVAMNDLIDEVGVDAVRYFFVARDGTSHLDFNLDLAKSLSSTNPVYYAQYTHARLNSVLENGAKYYDGTYVPALLTNDYEVAVIKALKEYGSRIEEAAETKAPYKMALYIQTLATAANEWYQHCRVVNDDDIPLTKSRLALAKAVKTVLADSLDLIGVSAPEHM